MDFYGKSDKAILRDLGRRLRRARLQRNLSQLELAERAGLNRTTISEYERGASSSTLTLVQVLRALEMLPELEDFLPEPGLSPLALVRRQGRRRERATGSRRRAAEDDDTGTAKDDPAW